LLLIKLLINYPVRAS